MSVEQDFNISPMLLIGDQKTLNFAVNIRVMIF